MPFAAPSRVPARAGVGFKPDHADAILDGEASVGWFEIHAENYMGAGGPPHALLARLRDRYPVSLHGVGLSIGGEGPLDRRHLSRLADVASRYDTGLLSEHLAWSTHDGAYFNDLLPLPYTGATLQRVCDHIDLVQEVTGRRMLLENPATYVTFASSTLTETQFLRDIVRRTGCGLLLDVNNVFVSATNHGFDPDAYLADFPLDAVGEIHLAGHAPDQDETGAPLLVDTHDRPVADPVWVLYASVIARIGAVPTLIEWDTDVPAWPVLQAEAQRADRILAGASPAVAAAAATGARHGSA